MSFDRERLPSPEAYFVDRLGWKLQGRGNWRTTACPIHGGSDSLRVNLASGGFVCMAGCEFHGGDVLAAEMQLTGADFVTAAKTLGAWIEDGRPSPQHMPSPLPARQALQLLAAEANLTAIAAGNVARGVALSDVDLQRLMTASVRITRLSEMFA